jgi:renalase
MRVIVVGAGLSGLVAARTLTHAGHEVVVFDKGRSAGGRCATRRIGDAVVDHGAQFFTVRDDEFSRLVAEWIEARVVTEWCRGFDGSDGHPRYCGVGGMTTIAKHLATGLDVRYNAMVFTIDRESHGWCVRLDDGSRFDADGVIVTCPIPQSVALLVHAGLEIPDGIRTTEYDKTIAALVVVEGESLIPPPGGIQNADDTFSFIADNHAKGISPVAALTFHCNATFSEDHWWHDTTSTHQLVMRRAQPWIGTARVVSDQPKRWRMATPRSVWPERCWSHDRLVLAGDAFGGPRIEGAVLSGLAAARRVVE